MALLPLLLPQADLLFDPAFLPTAEADALLTQLTAEVVWEQRAIRLFGQEVPQPRLTAWYGDPAAHYTYSGLSWEPRPWTPVLLCLRQRIEAATSSTFNSVLLNYYRDGRDSMGWHADDEPELGSPPLLPRLAWALPGASVCGRAPGWRMRPWAWTCPPAACCSCGAPPSGTGSMPCPKRPAHLAPGST